MAVTLSKYGSSINRLLCHLVGLSTDTKPIGTYTDKSGKVFLLENGSSFEEMDTDKKYLYDAESQTWNLAASGGGGGSTLIEKSISANGVYNASEDSADGYSKVTVDVSNTYTAEDEGKVVDNGALVAQTAMSSEVTENGTVDTTLYNSVTVNVPSGGVEFSNTPAAFTLLNNIQNLDVIIPSGITSIDQNAFTGCTGLTSIEIPNSVTSIGNNAFYYCTGLTSIEIPSGVTIIADNVFSGCTGLTSIEIPSGVTSIGKSAFSGLNIESLEIPNSVTEIKSSACASLRKLKSLKFISSTPPTIYANAFNQLALGCKIYVPSGSLSAYTAVANMPSSSTYTYVEY